jgi:hypothetical protein
MGGCGGSWTSDGIEPVRAAQRRDPGGRHAHRDGVRRATTPNTGWSQLWPTTFRKGQVIWADSVAGTAANLLYTAIGAGNLRPFVDGQDTVGHFFLGN